MPQVFSFTELIDGKRLFLANPQIPENSTDDSGYQYFEVFDDEYLDESIGYLGFNVSSSVHRVWELGKLGKTRKKLTELMRIALPLLILPLSFDEYKNIQAGYFPVISLFSEGSYYFNKETLVVQVPSGKSPENFFKTTIFKGHLTEDDVKQIILHYGYVEGLSSQYGDFRFSSGNITDTLWPIRPERILKAYKSLIEDGKLERLGERLLMTGLPSYTRIPAHSRRSIESTHRNTMPSTPTSLEEALIENVIVPETKLPEYISKDAQKRLVEAAQKRNFNTKKLEQILMELNEAVARKNVQSSHVLIRALLDHIPPLFSYKSFDEVANNYSWSETNRKRVKLLSTFFRYDADDSLHRQISKKDSSLDMELVSAIRTAVNAVVDEATDQDNI
jgi:hypothetical protein